MVNNMKSNKITVQNNRKSSIIVSAFSLFSFDINFINKH